MSKVYVLYTTFLDEKEFTQINHIAAVVSKEETAIKYANSKEYRDYDEVELNDPVFLDHFAKETKNDRP